jgi:hypothetical protein
MTCPHPQCQAVRRAAEALLACFPDDVDETWPEITAMRAALAQEPAPAPVSISISTTRVHSPAQGGEARAEEDRTAEGAHCADCGTPEVAAGDRRCMDCRNAPAPSTKEKPHDP